MDELAVFRKIKEIAKEHYLEEQNLDISKHFERGVKYLTDCQRILYIYFSEHKIFSKKFLYTTLSYIDQRAKTKTKTVLINDSTAKSGYYWSKSLLTPEQEEEIDIFFRDFISEINNKNLISLTNILFDRSWFKVPDFIISNENFSGEDIYRISESTEYNQEPICLFEFNQDIFEETDKEKFYQSHKNSISSFINIYKHQESNDLDTSYINKVSDYFHRYQQVISLFKKFRIEKSYFNFIKPFLEGNNYNVLLTITTSEQLSRLERTLVNQFLYEIVSHMAADYQALKTENEKLKRRKSYTLTTHGLKTEIGNSLLQLSRTLRKKYNVLAKKNPVLENLRQNIYSLDKNIHQIYSITGIHSLLEKVDDRESFIFSAKDDELLQEEKVDFDVLEYCSHINELYEDDYSIHIETDLNLNEIDFKIFDLFFSEIMMKLFYGTLFENLTRYAEPENELLKLHIYRENDYLVFKNKKNANASLTKRYLRGNLGFFKSIIEDTKTGLMDIDRSDSENYYIKLKL
ncbi:MAG: hypothetical protein ABJL44_15470 [Algibacter sp.]